MGCLLKAAGDRGGHFEGNILDWFRNHKRLIFMNVIFGGIVYFMMMAGNLVNSYDGIWSTSYFVAGRWETSLGRGLLHYIDKARAGVVSGPLNTILSLFFIAVAAGLMLDLCTGRDRILGGMASLLLIANPVTCATLSYCYTSVGYAAAFLFGVLSAYSICRKRGFAGILLGAVFTAMSLGCYQAYFGVVCCLLLLQVMRMFLTDTSGREVMNYMIRSLLAVVGGGIFYSLISRLLLWKYGIGLSSYGGAAQVSIGKIITSLPMSVLHCYRSFYDFIAAQKMAADFSDKTGIVLIGIGGIIIACVIRQVVTVWRRNRVFAVCFLACIILVPVACNAVLLLTDGSGMSILMSMGMVLGVALLPMAVLSVEGRGGKLIKWGGYALMSLLVWLNVLAVTNDQLALKEGKNAATALTGAMVSELISGGYLENGAPVAFVGKPCGNSLFEQKDAWSRANGYARFGDYWGTDSGNNYRSWVGVLSECCGVKLRVCSVEKYEELKQKEAFSNMPDFPAEGSIREIDGVIVVKVSGSY